MATKRAPPIQLTDALVAEVEAHVRAERFVPSKKLVRGKLSRHDELLLLEKLAVRGLERTTKGVRTPLADQIKASVEDATPVPFAALAKRVSGATAAELKRTSLELIAADQLVLVAGLRTDEIALPGTDLLALAEVDTLRALAKMLPKLVARVRPRKGMPPRTLTRAEARSLLEPLIGILSSPDDVRDLPAEHVLDLLTRLEQARGRSVFVPDLVRALAPPHAPALAHDRLLALARAGRIELRPESGVGNLSASDRALCPSDVHGTVISYARVIPRGGT